MTTHLRTLIALIALVGLVAFAAGTGCAGDSAGPADQAEPSPPPGGAAGGEDNTFDHPDIQPDIWELYDRMLEEGPPKYTSRVHSCPKVRYRTIGNLLTSRGVNIAGGTPDTAGDSYSTSGQALGQPNYGARLRENLDLTTASASKLFDIFVQAAPEIIASMPTRPECQVDGVGAQMFNEYDQCSADGISCLIGVPASPAHIEVCNATVRNATTPDKGKRMAVALLAAAAHTCE